MKVTIVSDVSDWATPEEFARMSDREIIACLLDDLYEVTANAVWTLDRS